MSVSISFKGVEANGAYAADPSIAAGPSSIVLVGNSTVTIHDKSGNMIAATNPLIFFNRVRLEQENAGDARAVYDRQQQRVPWLSTSAMTTDNA